MSELEPVSVEGALAHVVETMLHRFPLPHGGLTPGDYMLSMAMLTMRHGIEDYLHLNGADHE